MQNITVAKLHSDLRVLTLLQLDGVGVDFVFACHNKNKKNKNPHLASARRNGPTCLKFSSCPVGVLRVSGGCLDGVSRGCLDGVWRMGCKNSLQDV